MKVTELYHANLSTAIHSRRITPADRQKRLRRLSFLPFAPNRAHPAFLSVPAKCFLGKQLFFTIRFSAFPVRLKAQRRAWSMQALATAGGSCRQSPLFRSGHVALTAHRRCRRGTSPFPGASALRRDGRHPVPQAGRKRHTQKTPACAGAPDETLHAGAAQTRRLATRDSPKS